MTVDIGPYLNLMYEKGVAIGKSDGLKEAGDIIERFFHASPNASFLDFYVELQREIGEARGLHVDEYCAINVIPQSEPEIVIATTTPEGVPV